MKRWSAWGVVWLWLVVAAGCGPRDRSVTGLGANGPGTSTPPSDAAAAPAPPRLIVLIVIDQFRGDYLDRFGQHFGAGGFARLMRDGAHYVNAHFSNAVTTTGPGHACIATGTNPRIHGISANDDEDGPCTADSDYPIVGLGDERRTARGASPVRLRVPTLGDVMKVASAGHAHVVSVALKRRAAVLLAGQAADRALWWEPHSGRFVTSRWYGDTLPDYIRALNEQHVADRYFGTTWTRLLPASAYAVCVADDDPYELERYGLGRTFPHPLNGGLDAPGSSSHHALLASPFGNELLMEVVRQALAHEPLGRDEVCDLLCVGLSSNDTCGHYFGPDSHEVLDITARTDRQLAELLALLDQRIGRGRYIVAVTGDHGVAPVAEQVRRFHLDAGRFSEHAARDALNNAVRDALGIPDEHVRPVASVTLPWVHLNKQAIADAKLIPERVQQICLAELRKRDGVGWVYPSAYLARPLPGYAEHVFRLAWQAYHPQLAGELYVGLLPYWHKSGHATSHGTPHSYDRHVPILLYGPGIRPGRYAVSADPIDIARTLAVLLGIEPAATMTGRVLYEALDTSPRMLPAGRPHDVSTEAAGLRRN